jgi:hypothetical protein
MIWTLLLLLVATALEFITERPFLATRAGALFGLALGGARLEPNLLKVPRLPAVGFRAAAQTWGETVLLEASLSTPELQDHPRMSGLLAHEACHVAQYRRLGSLGFWARYLAEWVWGLARTHDPFRAYWEMPLEREARRAEAAAATPA